ncbi:MAG: 3-isopropylmalate dehydratase small subunit [Bacillota bacterium]|uniref:3-isopropylmalate dehydratase small subunit n=1 Tax=Thermanaerosceptrum fracticalcis TaxID=1712410 RepID=A0A7G6E3H7_THEFR|nr:3-isopropylmalate dehydratase small subunit [Thermanaerosceptrum fracticalcis]QNB46631.1 3-isopropylmalate dehydratase small subunit [Thermanaerosceptrum fracticalcis]
MAGNKISGQVWKVGHDVDTDLIIAARYLNRSEPEFLAQHCLEDLIPNLLERVKAGDILVAGKNFGCGSSREHAPIALKAAGFSCVIAESFARIFYRNAINIGLPIIVAPEVSRTVQEGSKLGVDPVSGEIKDLTTGTVFRGEPFPPFMLEILGKGGLIPYVREKVKNRG